jgi:hypothetical protein
MNPKVRPVIDPADVAVGFTGSASSPRGGNRLRLSRALDVRAMTITVRHLPTGIVSTRTSIEGLVARSDQDC